MDRTVAVVGSMAVATAVGVGLWYVYSTGGISLNGGTGSGSTATPVYILSVLDYDTKQPVSGATVTAGQYTKISGADGKVRFSLPLGNYKVSITHPKYAPAKDVLWWEVVTSDIGLERTSTVSLKSNTPEIVVPVGYETEAKMGILQYAFPVCNCCKVQSPAFITVAVQDKAGLRLQNQNVRIRRIAGPHKLNGKGTDEKYKTDARGILRVRVEPTGGCKCVNPLTGFGLIATIDYKMPRTGVTEWEVSLVEDPSVKRNVETNYASGIAMGLFGAPSFGDEFWDALVA